MTVTGLPATVRVQTEEVPVPVATELLKTVRIAWVSTYTFENRP